MSVSWIDYKGKQILYINYNKAKSENEIFDILYEGYEERKKATEKIYSIINYTGVKPTNKFINEIYRLGKEMNVQEKLAKTALLGITGIQVAFVKSYILFTGDRNLKICSSEQQAYNWLIE